MKLIPAISIKNGCVALAENGQYSYMKNPEGQYRSPVSLLKNLRLPGEEVFVLDIDGFERNSPDLYMVKRMAAYKDIWLDAGTRDADSMMDILVSDASRVIMGTIRMKCLDELRGALEVSDAVMFSVGFDGGIVAADPAIAGMGIGELMGEIKDIPGLHAGLLFDLGSIRDRRGIDVSAVSDMAQRFGELYVLGHAEKGDFNALESAGASGIITDLKDMEDAWNERP